MLEARHLDFQKIAQTISGSEGFSASTGSSSGGSSGGNNGYGRRYREKVNVNDTLSKAREKHDVQPLAKDRRTSRKPNDVYHLVKSFKSQKRLGRIEDKRLTHAHLRSHKTPLRFGDSARSNALSTTLQPVTTT